MSWAPNGRAAHYKDKAGRQCGLCQTEVKEREKGGWDGWRAREKGSLAPREEEPAAETYTHLEMSGYNKEAKAKQCVNASLKVGCDVER